MTQEIPTGPDPERPDRRDAKREQHERGASGPGAPAVLGSIARHGSLGLQFAGTILAFGAIGYFADRALGTAPWLLLTGILLGSVGGFISLIKKVPGPKPRGRPGPEPPERQRKPPADPR